MRKTQFVLASLLIMSIVATGFAMAEESGTAVSADKVVSEVNAGVSIDDLAELDESAASEVPSTWKARPSIPATYGQGWSTKGAFTKLAILSKTFVNSANTEESKTVFRGRMVIGESKYGLRATSTTADALSGTMEFDVYKDGNKIDTLTLQVSNKYGEMSIRTGEFDGSEVTFATKTIKNIQKPVRTVRNGAVKANSAEVQANGDVSVEARAVPAKRTGLGGIFDRIFAKRVEARAQVRAATPQPTN